MHLGLIYALSNKATSIDGAGLPLFIFYDDSLLIKSTSPYDLDKLVPLFSSLDLLQVFCI